MPRTTPAIRTKPTIAPEVDMEFCVLEFEDPFAHRKTKSLTFRIVVCKEYETCKAGIIDTIFSSQIVGIKLGYLFIFF